jgi:hypothetical protein
MIRTVAGDPRGLPSIGNAAPGGPRGSAGAASKKYALWGMRRPPPDP